MALASDVVNAALKKAGVTQAGVTPSAYDTNDALADLGDMLAQWNEKRWLIWHLLEFAFVATGQTDPYTVGPGGQFNMNPRPSRIESAFLRQLVGPNFNGLPVDYPLDVIPSRE